MTDELTGSRVEALRHYGFGTMTMKEIKVCSYCGTTMPATEIICSECGKALPEQNLYHVYKQRCRCCSSCDAIVSPMARYCPVCGTRLKKKRI